MHVNHRRLDTRVGQRLGGFERARRHDAGRKDDGVLTRPHGDGFAECEAVVGGRDDRVAPFAEADVYRIRNVERRFHHARHLRSISGTDHGHVWKRSHDRDVLEGHVRRAQRSINGTAAAGEQTHGQLVQTQVDRHLLEAAACQERGDCIDVRNVTVHRQARRHSDDRRFGDTFHEETVGHLALEFVQYAGSEVGTDE